MVQIGKEPAPSFDEPLEMLSACHERIEAQLATLERLCEHLAAQGNDTEARSAGVQSSPLRRRMGRTS